MNIFHAQSTTLLVLCKICEFNTDVKGRFIRYKQTNYYLYV